MKRIFYAGLLLALVCVSCNKYGHETEATDSLYYSNPIIDKYLADPCVKFDSGQYYLFATGQADDKRFIPIYRTRDFVHWEFVRGAVAGGSKTDWNYKHFWAPEVIKIKNLYYLYYTASPEDSPRNSGNRVGVARAKNIEGPYENIGVVIPHASIDGHPFMDQDSSMYIFYTIEHLNADSLKAGQIYADKMIAPDRVAGRPVQIVSHHEWQEGPFVQYRDNRYYLTYSCGKWQDSTYHLRYATSSSVLGGYSEQPDTILRSNAFVKGPGHHFIYADARGQDWVVYHGWDTAYTARYPRIDRIFYKDGVVSSDGPTYTVQPLSK